MKIGDLQALLGAKNSTKLGSGRDLELLTNRTPLKMTNIAGGATKQVTSGDIEDFLNEPRPSKAANALLEKSPVGLGSEPTSDDFKKMGYEFAGTQYHIGAPVYYESADGGKITIYDGKGTAEMGEDKRKIVYEKGNLIQEMYYDDNGNLKTGKIIVKDKVAGFSERSIGLFMENGKPGFIE